MVTIRSIPIYIIILYSCLFHIQAQEIEINNCSTTSNYASSSPFQTNLNRLLSSFRANGPLGGFFNDTVGANPDTVYGLVSCRGDLSIDDCRMCLNNATANITQLCPNGRQATLRYQNCLVRYSNRQFFSQGDNVPRELQSDLNVSAADAPRYNQVLTDLMRNLSDNAMSSQSRYASGSAAYTAFNDIFGLAQCTRDLSPSTCFSCLQSLYNDIPRCCESKIGARIVSTTCNIRYETSPFLQVASEPSPRPPQPDGIGGGSSTNVAAIIVPTVGGGVLVFAVCTYQIYRMNRHKMKRTPDIINDQVDIRNEESLQFDFNRIRIATNDFSDANKLGQGGFGAVYKGEFLDGQEIAVKRLSPDSGQGSQEFKNEVLLLHKLKHRNLVCLLGFCLRGEEKLLIYEYIPNRSLDKYIFDPTKKAELDWGRRYNIIVGIARGLLYLHQDSRLRIIHRDLKPGNILLDEEMNAKISDFGMAKLFGVDQTRGNTRRIAGTFGYMAPEYAVQGLFSFKSDVFSFGVLLLEIISGQKTNSFSLSGSSRHLLSYAWKVWRKGDALKLIDPILRGKFSANQVMRCIHIGLLCVQQNLDDRPTMSAVVLMLNSYSVTLKQPLEPAFILESTSGATAPRRDVDFNDRSLTYSGDEISLTIPR